jgi:hypothetical protein
MFPSLPRMPDLHSRMFLGRQGMTKSHLIKSSSRAISATWCALRLRFSEIWDLILPGTFHNSS